MAGDRRGTGQQQLSSAHTASFTHATTPLGPLGAGLPPPARGLMAAAEPSDGGGDEDVQADGEEDDFEQLRKFMQKARDALACGMVRGRMEAEACVPGL